MRRRPALVGGATAGVGVVILAVSVAVLAREIARSTEWGPTPLLGAAAGALLVLIGVGAIRDRRRLPAGHRQHDGPEVLFPYTPPLPDGGGHVPSYDWGGDAGDGGGGDCGGGGGGS